ncbi:MAG: hypothetical protein EOO74_02735 [Myxococcales bacterium]|nr:MAG: hypothetical protein EOO74_02735 [Myxococcales bacterium]
MSASSVAVGRIYRTARASMAQRFIRIDARLDPVTYRVTNYTPGCARPMKQSHTTLATLEGYNLRPAADHEIPDALWTGPARAPVAPAAPPPAEPQVSAEPCEAEVTTLLETLWMQKTVPASLLEAQSEQLMELAIRLRRIARGTP